MGEYKVYAENMEGKRRFISNAIADRGGNGLFSLYADECGDEEQIVIVARELSDSAAVMGSIKSDRKASASRENGKRGGAPMKTRHEIIIAKINGGNVSKISRHQVTTDRGAERLKGKNSQIWMTRETADALGGTVETFWGTFQSGTEFQIKIDSVMKNA